MFGIGPLELMIVVVFAIIFIGPKKLPEMMKQAGRFFVQARRYTGEVRSTFQGFVREAEMEIQKEEVAKLRKELDLANQIKSEATTIGDYDGDDHGPEFYTGADIGQTASESKTTEPPEKAGKDAPAAATSDKEENDKTPKS